MEWVPTNKPGSWFLKLTELDIEGSLDVVKQRLRAGDTVIILPPNRWNPDRQSCHDLVLGVITDDWRSYTAIRNSVKGYGDRAIRSALDKLWADRLVELKQSKRKKGPSVWQVTTWYRMRLIDTKKCIPLKVDKPV